MANLRIPSSVNSSRQMPRLPDIPGAKVDIAIGNALNKLGQSLTDYAKSEAVRSDKLLMGSAGIQGIIEASIEQTQNFYEFDDSGGIDYEQSILKSNNIVEYSEATWEEARQNAMEQVENLPWKTSDVKKSAVATVESAFKSQTNQQIKLNLVKQQDQLKSDYVESLLTEASFDPDTNIAQVIDTATNTIESMADSTKAKQNFLVRAKTYINNASLTRSGALEIFQGTDNQYLQPLFNAVTGNAKRTLKNALGLSSSNADSTDMTVTPVDIGALGEAKIAFESMPDGSNKSAMALLIAEADAQAKYNANIILQASALTQGSNDILDDPKGVDSYLAKRDAYLSMDEDQFISFLDGYSKFTYLPPNIASYVNEFLSQSSYNTRELQLVNELADRYNQTKLHGVSDQSKARLQTWIENRHLKDEDRLAVSMLVEGTTLSEAEQGHINGLKLQTNPTGLFGWFDSQLEDFLEANALDDEYDWDELTPVQQQMIANKLNLQIQTEAKIAKASKNDILAISGEVIRKRALRSLLNNSIIVPAPGSEAPLYIPFDLNVRKKNGQLDQISVQNVIQFYRDNLIKHVKNADPTLSGEELKEEVDNLIPNMSVFPNPLEIGTYTMRTEEGDVIGYLDPQLLVQDQYVPSAILSSYELDPASPDFILKQTSPFSPEQKEDFDSWKYEDPTKEESIQLYPFKEQFAEVLSDESFKALPVDQQYDMLQMLGDRLVVTSKADPYLMIPEFRRIYQQEYENFLESQKVTAGVVPGVGPTTNVLPKLIKNTMPSDWKNDLDELPWDAGRPQFKDQEWYDISYPEFEGTLEAEWVYQIYDKAVDTYTETLQNMSESQLRTVYNKAKSASITGLDLGIEHFTPLGVLQGYKEAAKIKNKSFVTVLKSKIERMAEVNDPTLKPTIIQQLVPTDTKIYAIIESESDATLSKRMRTISSAEASELRNAEVDMALPEDFVRIALMDLAVDKQMAQIIAGMSDKRMSRFLKKFLQTKVIGNGLQ